MPDPASPAAQTDETALADRDLLVQAAEDGGAIAMQYFRTGVQQWEKAGDLGPVTAADLAVNAHLLERLRGARPDYGWLSEESEDDDARLGAERVFIVDPIDGTRSFIAGEQGFAVAVAVVTRGVVTAAAVNLPARGQTFAAALGSGATLNGAPVSVSGATDPADATVLTSQLQMGPAHLPAGPPPLKRQFRPSLAWRMCLVAEGRFDCMLTFRDAFEWDIVAGALIAAEAGARVTDGHGGRLVFNSPRGIAPGVIVAPPLLHARLMDHRNPQSTGD